MSLLFQPKEASVLMCDFDGSVDPEMVKVRPVIVLARNRVNNKLVTVVPLSTTKPFVMQAHHHELSVNPLPANQDTLCWAKCDMVATVSIARLDRIKVIKPFGKREYVIPTIAALEFEAIRLCVVNALNLQKVVVQAQQKMAA